MYRVKVTFADLQDHKHLYQAGDEYPRAGLEVSEKRFAELSGRDNRMGYPLIEEVEPEQEEKREEPAKRTRKRVASDD